MKNRFLFIPLLGMLCAPASAWEMPIRVDDVGATVSDAARVIDGDTIVINGVHVRLYGIDAPESKQLCQKNGLDYECGTTATMLMAQLTYGKIITCNAVPGQRDRYGRMIGKCSTPEIPDISDKMVRSGQALSYRRYTMDYVPAEDEARLAKRGVWQGIFVYPWDWRRGVR
jgi:endonuclease YncB( thermonuclease family)